MERNYCTEAVVLKTRRFGDFHKSVTILSPEKGIINAVAHGAYKGRSRISSITDPFCISVFDLYHNPVKDLWKITGCESRALNSRIRENLNAHYNAVFWSELILKSHSLGADFPAAYELFTSAVSCLDRDNTSAAALTLQFLYRFLLNSGFISDFSECGHCGKAFDKRGSSDIRLYYSPAEGCFLCSSCASSGLSVFDADTVRYLEESSLINLEEAMKKRLDLTSEINIRNSLLAVVKSIIDAPLNTLDYIDYGME